MGISNAYYESIGSLLDDVLHYYQEDEYDEIAENKDVLLIVATTLKIINRLGYWRPSSEDLLRIEEYDWNTAAKIHILEYIKDHYTE